MFSHYSARTYQRDISFSEEKNQQAYVFSPARITRHWIPTGFHHFSRDICHYQSCQALKKKKKPCCRILQEKDFSSTLDNLCNQHIEQLTLRKMPMEGGLRDAFTSHCLVPQILFSTNGYSLHPPSVSISLSLPGFLSASFRAPLSSVFILYFLPPSRRQESILQN